MSGKRRFVRLDTDFNVEYRLDSKKKSALKIVLKNIGQGGICFILDEPVEKDTGIDIRFFLPEFGELVECRGRVAWQHGYTIKNKKIYHTGIEFTDIKDQDKEKLSRYIYAQLLAQPPK